MKFMIFAAGLGTGLRPLTLKTPKPLIPIHQNVSCLERLLTQLSTAGFTEGWINVSYQSQQIIDFVQQGQPWAMHLHICQEPENTPLGTAAGLRQALPHLGPNPFLTLSADLWTDYPFATLKHLTPETGHCILVPNPPHHPCGDFDLHNQYLHPRTHASLTYANIAVLHPKLLIQQPQEKNLGPILKAACNQRTLTGALYHGQWYNVGSLTILKQLRQTLGQPSHNH
jgi:N-acetyl-alpha-D-muramate 1-phosphate uridylyltransferase